MTKKLLKYGKILLALILIGALTLPSYATVGASDGSAFVTKAEFDAALSDFNARLTTFEAGINSKIDSQVSSYLDRNGIWNKKIQEFATAPNGMTPWKGTKSGEWILGFAVGELLKQYTSSNNTRIWYGLNADNITISGGPTSGLHWWRNLEKCGYLETKGRQWKKIVSNISKTGLLYMMTTTPYNYINHYSKETTDNLRYDLGYYAYILDRNYGDNWRDRCTSSGKNAARSQYLYLLNFYPTYAAQVDHLMMSRYVATAPHVDTIADDSAMEIKQTDTMYNEIFDGNTAKTKAGSLTVAEEPNVVIATTAKVNPDTNQLEFGEIEPVFSIGSETTCTVSTNVYMCFVSKGDDLYYGADIDLSNNSVWCRSGYAWGMADYVIVKDCSVY